MGRNWKWLVLGCVLILTVTHAEQATSSMPQVFALEFMVDRAHGIKGGVIAQGFKISVSHMQGVLKLNTRIAR